MESLDDSKIAQSGHERVPAARGRKSADKSDALQTLRAVPKLAAVAERLDCVRLQRRFS
jgi:hypothetical protein